MGLSTAQSTDLIRTLEPRARRAWPALEEARLEGWILRAAAGITRRSNSFHAEHDVVDVPRALERARAWFAARDLPLRAYLTPASRPEGLEARLVAEGWERETGALVQVADLPLGPRAPAESCEAAAPLLHAAGRLEDEWLERLAAWRELDEPSRLVHRRILGRVPGPCAFVTVGDGTARAVGLAVRDGPWVGLFDLVTDPAVRRAGWGRRLVGALLAWGLDAGARRAYLQVQDDNGPALALYAGLGFRTAYAYSYRRSPG